MCSGLGAFHAISLKSGEFTCWIPRGRKEAEVPKTIKEQVRIRPEVHRALKVFAAQERQTMGDLVEALILQAIEAKKGGVR